jgi:Uma2 family endonuclease
MSTAVRQATAEDLLDMPDDGMERFIIDGVLYEEFVNDESQELGMTVRNSDHARLVIRIGGFMDQWLMQQPKPRGWVGGGEAAIRLKPKPETSIGVDVAYVSPDVMAKQKTKIIEGVPSLIVEVLSPSDRQEKISKKLRSYLKAGVKHVWVVDPEFQTVMIHRPNAKPVSVNADGFLTAEPDMPGLKIELALVFE